MKAYSILFYFTPLFLQFGFGADSLTTPHTSIEGQDGNLQGTGSITGKGEALRFSLNGFGVTTNGTITPKEVCDLVKFQAGLDHIQNLDEPAYRKQSANQLRDQYFKTSNEPLFRAPALYYLQAVTDHYDGALRALFADPKAKEAFKTMTSTNDDDLLTDQEKVSVSTTDVSYWAIDLRRLLNGQADAQNAAKLKFAVAHKDASADYLAARIKNLPNLSAADQAALLNLMKVVRDQNHETYVPYTKQDNADSSLALSNLDFYREYVAGYAANTPLSSEEIVKSAIQKANASGNGKLKTFVSGKEVPVEFIGAGLISVWPGRNFSLKNDSALQRLKKDPEVGPVLTSAGC